MNNKIIKFNHLRIKKLKYNKIHLLYNLLYNIYRLGKMCKNFSSCRRGNTPRITQRVK